MVFCTGPDLSILMQCAKLNEILTFWKLKIPYCFEILKTGIVINCYVNVNMQVKVEIGSYMEIEGFRMFVNPALRFLIYFIKSV